MLHAGVLQSAVNADVVWKRGRGVGIVSEAGRGRKEMSQLQTQYA